MSITPEHDMTWTMLSLKPGFDVKAGETVCTMVSPCGRIFLAMLPHEAQIYRRNIEGDFVLVTTIDLT